MTSSDKSGLFPRRQTPRTPVFQQQPVQTHIVIHKPILTPTVPIPQLVPTVVPKSTVPIPQLVPTVVPKSTVPIPQLVPTVVPKSTVPIPQLVPTVVPKSTVPVKSPFNIGKQPTQWLNLKVNIFNESPTQWYNLHTSRLVSNKPTTYSPVYGLKGIRILGTREEVEQFCRINSQKLSQLFPGNSCETLLFEPFENITFLSEDAAERTQLCFIGTAGTVIPATTSTDVSILSQEQLDSMCRFTFGGLFVKGRIDTIIDGDTFDIVFYVPLVMLSRSRALGDKRLHQTPAIPNVGFEKIGFFAKVSIRMYGYDAAEKDTEPGKLAKLLMEEKLRSLGGVVWCQFIEATIADDKYGRTLAVLYEDEQKTRLLNNFLLEQEKIHGIKMVYPYLGGTKKQF